MSSTNLALRERELEVSPDAAQFCTVVIQRRSGQKQYYAESSQSKTEPDLALGERELEVSPDVPEPEQHRHLPEAHPGGEFFIKNVLVRIHFVIRMILWTGLAPWEFEFTFLGSRISTRTHLALRQHTTSPVRTLKLCSRT